MFCPSCGTQNSEAATVCVSCARPLPPPTPASGAAGMAPVPGVAPALSYAVPAPPPQVRPRPKTMHVLGGIGIAAVVLLVVLFAFFAPIPSLPNETQADGYRLGRFFAALGIPLLVAYP